MTAQKIISTDRPSPALSASSVTRMKSETASEISLFTATVPVLDQRELPHFLKLSHFLVHPDPFIHHSQCVLHVPLSEQHNAAPRSTSTISSTTDLPASAIPVIPFMAFTPPTTLNNEEHPPQQTIDTTDTSVNVPPSPGAAIAQHCTNNPPTTTSCALPPSPSNSSDPRHLTRRPRRGRHAPHLLLFFNLPPLIHGLIWSWPLSL